MAKVCAVNREDSEMHKHWPELAEGLLTPLKELHGGAPEVMETMGMAIYWEPGPP